MMSEKYKKKYYELKLYEANLFNKTGIEKVHKIPKIDEAIERLLEGAKINRIEILEQKIRIA